MKIQELETKLFTASLLLNSAVIVQGGLVLWLVRYVKPLAPELFFLILAHPVYKM